jgi:CheY-like chemotaxis protein
MHGAGRGGDQEAGAAAPLILVVEDEAPMRKYLRAALGDRGYRVVDAPTGADGLAHASLHNPSIVLLDLVLPDLEGLEVTRRLRDWMTAPIIVVSARTREEDKIAALDAGANDYVTKPFATGELLARIRVWLRHGAMLGPSLEATVLEAGELRVDLVRRLVFAGDREVHLTPHGVQAPRDADAQRRPGDDAQAAPRDRLGPAADERDAVPARVRGTAAPEARNGVGAAALPAH